jgi:hypothetical protein
MVFRPHVKAGVKVGHFRCEGRSHGYTISLVIESAIVKEICCNEDPSDEGISPSDQWIVRTNSTRYTYLETRQSQANLPPHNWLELSFDHGAMEQVFSK